jgi:hypothetical protein
MVEKPYEPCSEYGGIRAGLEPAPYQAFFLSTIG